MIVICTGCQARFRVADEKIGPRGAKVRCSRCQTVFVVKRDAPDAPPVAPRIELDLTPGFRAPSPPRELPGPAGGPAGASVIPFPAAAQAPAPDPFAAAGLDAFGEPVPAASDDPFAQAAGTPPVEGPPSLDLRPAGVGEPIAPRGETEPPPSDPFAQIAVDVPEPFPGTATGTTGALPVTDLAQILGASAPAMAPPPPPPPPAPPASPPPPPVPEPAEASTSGPDLAGDLALEEHSDPGHQAPFADPADVMISGDSAPGAHAGGAFGSAAFEQGPLGALSGSEEPLALATEPTPGPPEPVLESPPPPAPAAEAPPRPQRRAAAAALDEDDGPEPAAAHPATPVGHRLRSAAVNALALVALLAIALGFRVVLRGEAALGPSALRPSTLLRAFGAAPHQTGLFEVAGVRAGVYPQSSGGALLFVRGEVVSRAPAPVAAVRVEAELVRDGQVLARGEARAGAIPTPEEVDRAGDRAALDQLAAATRQRAPKLVAPGDRLAFLITLGDAPTDVAGASIRVRAEVDGGGP